MPPYILPLSALVRSTMDEGRLGGAGSAQKFRSPAQMPGCDDDDDDDDDDGGACVDDSGRCCWCCCCKGVCAGDGMLPGVDGCVITR